MWREVERFMWKIKEICIRTRFLGNGKFSMSFGANLR